MCDYEWEIQPDLCTFYQTLMNALGSSILVMIMLNVRIPLVRTTASARTVTQEMEIQAVLVGT